MGYGLTLLINTNGSCPKCPYCITTFFIMSFQSLLKKEKSTSSEMKYWNILVPNLALISDGDWSQRKGCSPLLPCIEIAQISSDSEGFDPSDYSIQ